MNNKAGSSWLTVTATILGLAGCADDQARYLSVGYMNVIVDTRRVCANVLHRQNHIGGQEVTENVIIRRGMAENRKIFTEKPLEIVGPHTEALIELRGKEVGGKVITVICVPQR